MCCVLFVVCRLLLVDRCVLFVVWCLLIGVCCLLVFVGWLCVVCCLVGAVCGLLSSPSVTVAEVAHIAHYFKCRWIILSMNQNLSPNYGKKFYYNQ